MMSTAAPFWIANVASAAHPFHDTAARPDIQTRTRYVEDLCPNRDIIQPPPHGKFLHSGLKSDDERRRRSSRSDEPVTSAAGARELFDEPQASSNRHSIRSWSSFVHSKAFCRCCKAITHPIHRDFDFRRVRPSVPVTRLTVPCTVRVFV